MAKNNINVLTYSHPHRKTFDLLWKLWCTDEKVSVYTIPWVERKAHAPLYQHRPEIFHDIYPEILCSKLNFKIYQLDSIDQLDTGGRKVLIAGAGIIPKEVTKRNVLINAHPGYLPNSKGLDAFKWAILENEPIGVTTHIIDENIDQGILIDRQEIRILPGDTFHSTAWRVYRKEIDMLAMAWNKEPRGTSLRDSYYAAHKRMPKEQELILMDKFRERRLVDSMLLYYKTKP